MRTISKKLKLHKDKSIQERLINPLIELIAKISKIEKVREIAYNIEGNTLNIWIYADLSMDEDSIIKKIIDIEYDFLRKYKELLIDLNIIPLKDLNSKNIVVPKDFQKISFSE
jgi:hypothetical protein